MDVQFLHPPPHELHLWLLPCRFRYNYFFNLHQGWAKRHFFIRLLALMRIVRSPFSIGISAQFSGQFSGRFSGLFPAIFLANFPANFPSNFLSDFPADFPTSSPYKKRLTSQYTRSAGHRPRISAPGRAGPKHFWPGLSQCQKKRVNYSI